MYESDITVDLQSNNIEIHNKRTEDWKVSLVDTGYESSIAQRLLKIQDMTRNGIRKILPVLYSAPTVPGLP